MYKVYKMISIIQIYIFYKTGKEVDISPVLPKDMAKLLLAYSIAKKWVDNNITIKTIGG